MDCVEDKDLLCVSSHTTSRQQFISQRTDRGDGGGETGGPKGRWRRGGEGWREEDAALSAVKRWLHAERKQTERRRRRRDEQRDGREVERGNYISWGRMERH